MLQELLQPAHEREGEVLVIFSYIVIVSVTSDC